MHQAKQFKLTFHSSERRFSNGSVSQPPAGAVSFPILWFLAYVSQALLNVSGGMLFDSLNFLQVGFMAKLFRLEAFLRVIFKRKSGTTATNCSSFAWEG